MPGAMRTREGRGVGGRIPLLSLAPEFSHEQHQVYAAMLERAIDHPDTQNIALTGAYGSGKSSVLRAVRDNRRKRQTVVELSLSTLDPKVRPIAAENPAEKDVTNQIQKEIVKQLLYTLPPRRTPHSRFPRATQPAMRGLAGASIAAALVVSVIWLVATLSDWGLPLNERLDELGWPAPLFWIAMGMAAVVVAAVGWWMLAGRYAVRAGVAAGSLTVSLEPTSSSYFDQYLDEIVYFFQVSRANLVVIEDIDRFSDATVLDTLRALNHLVNKSRQVGRRVVFVYAIRDSVLAQIGTDSRTGLPDPDDADESDASLSIARANRAKYFDVILPIVPFVTSQNARDLLIDVMKPHVAAPGTTAGISPALIRIAARHVADMRTMRSLRNEYEVHADRLITSAATPMPEITPDIVFSLVLLRATSPLTYEKIRLASSNLDKLVARWVELVDVQIEHRTILLTDLQTQIENETATDGRARRAGDQLESLRTDLSSLAPNFTTAMVSFSGALNDDDLGNADGWGRIANGEAVLVTITDQANPYRSLTDTVRLTAGMLAPLVGMKVDAAEWARADLEELRRQVERAQEEITFLRHHKWSELISRGDLTVEAAPGEAVGADDDGDAVHVTFAELVEHYAPTTLCRELIEYGSLPRHFARYSSMFYEGVVSLNATEFISRAVEPGRPIVEYELTDDDVTQILTEQQADGRDDADLFEDLSVYNLDILGYLLRRRPRAAELVARRLGERWGEAERAFVTRFLQRESRDAAAELAKMMTPHWQQALSFTAVDVKVPPQLRTHLVDAVLSAIPAAADESVTPEVGQFLTIAYPRLRTVIEPTSDARAAIVMSAMRASGGVIADLSVLNRSARNAAATASIYPVTAANVAALAESGSVALDVLVEERAEVFRHVLADLPAYLSAIRELGLDDAPVADAALFPSTLSHVAATSYAREFIESTPDDYRVEDLNDVDARAWRHLLELKRTKASFANIQLYLAEEGLDESLGVLLTAEGCISTPETGEIAQRAEVVELLIAARDVIPNPDVRVALAASLQAGGLTIAQVEAEDASLVAPLLVAGLLPDVASTFSSGILARWADLEAALAASSGVVGFLDAAVVPPIHLSSAITSRVLDEPLRQALITNLRHQLEGATPSDATATARAVVGAGAPLDLDRVTALRDARASKAAMVTLLNDQAERLGIEGLRTVLGRMGGDYTRLATGGLGTIRFDVDSSHTALLARLEAVTHTGAAVKWTLAHGTKLEANLKRAAG